MAESVQTTSSRLYPEIALYVAKQSPVRSDF